MDFGSGGRDECTHVRDLELKHAEEEEECITQQEQTEQEEDPEQESSFISQWKAYMRVLDCPVSEALVKEATEYSLCSRLAQSSCRLHCGVLVLGHGVAQVADCCPDVLHGGSAQADVS